MRNWLRNSFILFLLTLSHNVWAEDVVSQGQLLQDAIINKNVDEVIHVLKQGVDVNSKLPNGIYPIVYASKVADVAVMKLLTAHNVDVMVRAEGGVSAMHLAAVAGDIKKIKLLRALKVPTDIQDDSGVTPLYSAWLNGKLKVADYLIESEKAKVNVNDKEGNPLAFRVVKKADNPKVVKHMIKHKLNIFKRNKAGKNLFEVAQARKYEKSAEVLQQAIEQKLKAYQNKLNKKQ